MFLSLCNLASHTSVVNLWLFFLQPCFGVFSFFYSLPKLAIPMTTELHLIVQLPCDHATEPLRVRRRALEEKKWPLPFPWDHNLCLCAQVVALGTRKCGSKHQTHPQVTSFLTVNQVDAEVLDSNRKYS